MLFTAAAIFLYIGIILTLPLWLGPRTFPLSPLIALPAWLPSLALWLLSLSLLLGSLAPRLRGLRWLFVFSVLALIAADQNRLQPWFYEYIVLLFLVWDLRAAEAKTDRQLSVSILRIVVSCIYFWSGVQKMNASFLHYGVTWFASPLMDVSPVLAGAVALVFKVAPVIEMLLGILLLTRFQRLGSFLSISMHLMVLMLIGPWGRGWNTAVWPWNAAMIYFNIVLLRNSGAAESFLVPLRRASPLCRMVLVLFTTLPILSFFERWDMYLSFALYSWNTRDARFELDADADINQLPEGLRLYVHNRADSSIREISLFSWSYTELNVPPIPERRVFLNVGRTLCGALAAKGRLVIDERPRIFEMDGSETVYECKAFT